MNKQSGINQLLDLAKSGSSCSVSGCLRECVDWSILCPKHLQEAEEAIEADKQLVR